MGVCVHISAKNPFPLSFRIKNRVSLGLLFSRWHGDAAVYLWPGQQRVHISARHTSPACTPLQKSSRSLRGGAIRGLSLPRRRQFHSFLGAPVSAVAQQGTVTPTTDQRLPKPGTPEAREGKQLWVTHKKA